MNSKPIIMQAESVKAILAGTKSMTRRVIKPQPYVGFGNIKRPYAVGQELWVKETWCPVDDTPYGGEKWIDYRATPRYSALHPAGWDNEPHSPDALKWKPSIFMPKAFSRITLRVTGVRVERVNEISHSDAIAEGITPRALRKHCDSAQMAFRELWDSINGKKYPWASKPFVWVVAFERVTP